MPACGFLHPLQKQVLSLYRSALRLAHAKEQRSIAALARAEIERCAWLPEPAHGLWLRLSQNCAALQPQDAFAVPCRYRSVSRKDIQLVEHLLRRGRRQLDLVRAGDVTAVQLHSQRAP